MRALPQSNSGRTPLTDVVLNEDPSEISKWGFGRRSGLKPALTGEEQRSLNELRTRVQMYNKTVPNLRLRLPELGESPDLEVCADYYFRVRHAGVEENAPEKVAALLTSFLEEHEEEWNFCGWKNDAIADLILEKLGFGSTRTARREAADVWLKQYRKRAQKLEREADLRTSPLRMAASAAVFDLEMLVCMDETPGLWIRPAYKRYVSLVQWLNRNWPALASRKRGQTLQQEVLTRFRRKLAPNELSDSDLLEVCDIYRSLESSYPLGLVPPSQVVLVLVARNRKVSPRLVSSVRAEQRKLRISRNASGKARS